MGQRTCPRVIVKWVKSLPPGAQRQGAVQFSDFKLDECAN